MQTTIREYTYRHADDVLEVITIDDSRDALLTHFGKITLDDRYLMPGESYQDLFARVACAYAEDLGHAQRVYDYISRLWFMPATPVLSNGGTTRGLPISCFLNQVPDSLDGIAQTYNENIFLAAGGGGIGTYWGDVRGIGEAVGEVGKTSGIIPFVRVMDSLALAISQGSLRRGSAAVYLDMHHPEIEEFLEIRKASGDFNRKSLNLHHGVLVDDEFMQAVERGSLYALRSPRTGEVTKEVDARALAEKLMEVRMATGEPYIVFSDTVNRQMVKHHRKLGLKVTTSNLCSEIMLPTGKDHKGRDRTAVCCLSSLNVETFFQWQNDHRFIPDVMMFLKNVLADFVERAPASIAKATYAAMVERSVGLGVMGFHSFLQSISIPFDSPMAASWNHTMFAHIRRQADQASRDMAMVYGPCRDWLDAHDMAPDEFPWGEAEFFSNKMAIAPTASISIICGGTSAAIEPIPANIYTHKTLSGSFEVKNPYLVEVLQFHGKDTPGVWSTILEKGGSVQHLDFLSVEEKQVFKTSFEVDQMAIVLMSNDRAPFIDQGQSINIFLPADCEKWDMWMLHYHLWKGGSKSAYYQRSKSVQRAGFAGGVEADNTIAKPAVVVEEASLYEVCESCQ